MKSIENIGNFVVGILISIFSILYYVVLILLTNKSSPILDVYLTSKLVLVYCFSLMLILVPLIFLLVKKKQNWFFACFFYIVEFLDVFIKNIAFIGGVKDLDLKWLSYLITKLDILNIVYIVIFFIVNLCFKKTNKYILPVIFVVYSLMLLIIRWNFWDYRGNISLLLLKIGVSFLILMQVLIINDVFGTQKKKQYDYSIVNKSNADILTEYKELLDMGAITTEEFEQKKKEIMNL